MVNFYTCGKSFRLDILEEMLKPKVVYGLIIVDKREASIAVFEGEKFPKATETLVSDYVGKGNPHFSVERNLQSYYHGKTKKGGTKSLEIGHSIDNQSRGFMKRVARATRDVFMPEGKTLPALKGILVGGPEPTNHHFVNDGYLHPYLKKMLVSVEKVESCDESGIRELIVKAAGKLENVRLAREIQLMKALLEATATGKPVAYGGTEVEEALERGRVKTLLLSEELDSQEIDRLIHKAEHLGAGAEVLSSASEPGYQL
jgi:peptide chain release factor subunit 1